MAIQIEGYTFFLCVPVCVPWVRADTFSLFDKMKFYGTQHRAQDSGIRTQDAVHSPSKIKSESKRTRTRTRTRSQAGPRLAENWNRAAMNLQPRQWPQRARPLASCSSFFFLVLHRTVSGLVSFPRRAKQTNRQNQTGGESGENVQDNWMKIHSCAFRFGSTKKTFAHGTQPLAFCQQPKIRIFLSSSPLLYRFSFLVFFFGGGGYFVYFTCFLWCGGGLRAKVFTCRCHFRTFPFGRGVGILQLKSN